MEDEGGAGGVDSQFVVLTEICGSRRALWMASENHTEEPSTTVVQVLVYPAAGVSRSDGNIGSRPRTNVHVVAIKWCRNPSRVGCLR